MTPEERTDRIKLANKVLAEPVVVGRELRDSQKLATAFLEEVKAHETLQREHGTEDVEDVEGFDTEDSLPVTSEDAAVREDDSDAYWRNR